MKHEDINRELTAALKRQRNGGTKAVDAYITKIRRWVPIQIMLGVAAILLLFLYFGINAVVKTLLEWIIGITIATLIVTQVASRYKY